MTFPRSIRRLGRHANPASLPSRLGRGVVRYSVYNVSWGRFPSLLDAREQIADELEVPAHVGLDILAGRVGLEVNPALEADVRDRLDNRGKVDLSLAEIVGIVLEMEFADSVLAEPADLFHDVKAVISRIPNVVVDRDGFGACAVEDSRVVF